MVFEKILTLPFSRIVNGSISTDGRKVLLKNYTNIYYWERLGEESLSALFLRTPKQLPYSREPRERRLSGRSMGVSFLHRLKVARMNRQVSLFAL